jgi:hypothetical protein
MQREPISRKKSFPRQIHAISVFNSSIILCIQLGVGLFASILGRLPTTVHGEQIIYMVQLYNMYFNNKVSQMLIDNKNGKTKI